MITLSFVQMVKAYGLKLSRPMLALVSASKEYIRTLPGSGMAEKIRRLGIVDQPFCRCGRPAIYAQASGLFCTRCRFRRCDICLGSGVILGEITSYPCPCERANNSALDMTERGLPSPIRGRSSTRSPVRTRSPSRSPSTRREFSRLPSSQVTFSRWPSPQRALVTSGEVLDSNNLRYLEQSTLQRHIGELSLISRDHLVPINSNNECILCLSGPKNAVFIPCGHLYVCIDCAIRCNGRCPLCRSFARFQQVYQD